MVEFTLKVLQEKETILSSQFDDLKFDHDGMRVWLSRMTVDDGMSYNNQVTIEELHDGVWTTKNQYEAL